jgi:DNA-binding NtrC family response regulator
VDVRLIASTNKNLQHEVERGRFRRDLFFRIAVFMIHVPPLRERPEDIPLIAAHLWSGLNQRMGMKETALPVADEDLVNQPWTGNVRELRNFLERQLLYLRMGRSTGFDQVTGLENRTAAEPDARMVTLEEHSRNYVLDVLQRLNYNKAQTARVLGIGLSTLKRWLNQWGVRVERRLDNQESG